MSADHRAEKRRSPVHCSKAGWVSFRRHRGAVAIPTVLRHRSVPDRAHPIEIVLLPHRPASWGPAWRQAHRTQLVVAVAQHAAVSLEVAPFVLEVNLCAPLQLALLGRCRQNVLPVARAKLGARGTGRTRGKTGAGRH
jgi:hypothetical protein